MVRREGFEPPAFWSVGCLTRKSEPFRLRFVLFTAVRSAALPLFPPSPARSNPILGQIWVRENFAITKGELYKFQDSFYILEILSKVDPRLPLFGRQLFFNHVMQKSFQIIVKTVQVIENTRCIQVL